LIRLIFDSREEKNGYTAKQQDPAKNSRQRRKTVGPSVRMIGAVKFRVRVEGVTLGSASVQKKNKLQEKQKHSQHSDARPRQSPELHDRLPSALDGLRARLVVGAFLHRGARFSLTLGFFCGAGRQWRIPLGTPTAFARWY
jgi:hypothetical protein